MTCEHEIKIAQGDTIDIRANILSPTDFTQDDLAVCIIRDIEGNIVWDNVFDILQDDKGYYYLWHIGHDETEKWLGVYLYGVAIYKDAVLNDDMFPINGSSVEHAIIDATFLVVEPTAREEQ